MLEQAGFELRRPTKTWISFNKYTVGPLYPQVSHMWIQPTADRKQYVFQNGIFDLPLGIRREVLEQIPCKHRGTTVVKF